MDVGSAVLIFGPLLTPIAKNAGFDPVHFGIIMTANLEIGYLTPPVGLNLIVAMAAFRESFGFICRAVHPFHRHHARVAGRRLCLATAHSPSGGKMSGVIGWPAGSNAPWS